VPNYVRRDGTLNIASHFPSNTVAPDLGKHRDDHKSISYLLSFIAGPKMYNAMSSFESAGSKGSTRLHMDMADAVNIMTYASATPDGKPGCAVWDLFRAQDAEELRNFLRRKFKGTYQHDPIHSQQFYLDSQLRKELYDMHGIKSHRVYQRPGEAIFIPAGCAHQVRHLALYCSLILMHDFQCRYAISRTVSKSQSISSAPRTSHDVRN
jgi:lysine-specific demethylase 3